MSLTESSLVDGGLEDFSGVWALFLLLNHLGVFWLNSFLPFLMALLIRGRGIAFVFCCDTK